MPIILQDNFLEDMKCMCETDMKIMLALKSKGENRSESSLNDLTICTGLGMSSVRRGLERLFDRGFVERDTAPDGHTLSVFRYA